MTVFNKITPFKTKRMKGNTKTWLDGVKSRDKTFINLKNQDSTLTSEE